MRYRIALNGFSEFEFRAMQFSFQHRVGVHDSEYEIVEGLSKADFSVVDSDSELAVKMVVMSGRTDRAIFIGALAPAGAQWHFQRPIDPNRILRALDELTARESASGGDTVPSALMPMQSSAPIDSPLPILEQPERTPADDRLPPIVDRSVPPAGPPAAPEVSPAKNAARAASRRARLASSRRAPREVDPLSEVLVLDADAEASATLCTLLERFGFSAYSVRSIDKADEQLAARPYAAIFLDMALDGPGLALLERIHGLPIPKGKSAPAVLMVAENVDPADQVRAALAGISAPLIKPLTRGIVARALEDSRVTLPADARRV